MRPLDSMQAEAVGALLSIRSVVGPVFEKNVRPPQPWGEAGLIAFGESGVSTVRVYC